MRDYPMANYNFLAVALYKATTAMVDWIKVLELCVSTLMQMLGTTPAVYKKTPQYRFKIN